MVNQTDRKHYQKLKKNLVVNAVMSTENYNVLHTENAAQNANVLITSRKCVELQHQTVQNRRKTCTRR